MGKLSNSIILHDRVVYGSFKKKPTIGWRWADHVIVYSDWHVYYKYTAAVGEVLEEGQGYTETGRYWHVLRKVLNYRQ
jgi:hypothetical protein